MVPIVSFPLESITRKKKTISEQNNYLTIETQTNHVRSPGNAFIIIIMNLTASLN